MYCYCRCIDITGVLLKQVRNGLGIFEHGERTVIHAFDGLSKLSSWRFDGNQTALFSTRFLASAIYNQSIADGTIAPFLLFHKTHPPFSWWQQMWALVRGLDNMNINVYSFPAEDITRTVKYEGQKTKMHYFALSDYWTAYEIRPHDLSTGSSLTVQPAQNSHSVDSEINTWLRLPSLYMDLLSTAHPLPEPGTSFTLTFLNSISVIPGMPGLLKLIRIRSTHHREIIATWPVNKLSYMHSFSVTETHAIILAQPLYIDVWCQVMKFTPFDCLSWEPEKKSVVYLVELHSGHMQQYIMESVFCMHHINAFNFGQGKIVMDLSTYPDPKFIQNLQLSVLRDANSRNLFHAQAEIKRFCIDMILGTVRRIYVPPPVPAFISTLDMPSINKKYLSKTYCFVYGLAVKIDNLHIERCAVVKRDMCQQGRDRYWRVHNHYPVEPVFVAKPNAASEDDGLLLVPMIDGNLQNSYLAVLRAQDLTLLSSATLPTVVPYSLHGQFFREVH